MGFGRHGLLHLRAGSGALTARPLATLGNSRDQGQCGVLRRAAVRVVSGRLGAGIFVGPHCGQVRARAHADDHHRVVLDFYVSQRAGHERVAIGGATPARGHRNRRGVGHGRDLCGGRMAGEPQGSGRGYMHTGYYVGVFLAASVSYLIGNRWRLMFVVGGVPALLLAWVRHGVVEPARWVKKESVVRSWAVWRPFAALFTRAWRRRTILNTLFMLASICGLWAGTVYVPTAVSTLAEAAGRAAPQAAQLASRATMLVSFATILGCLAMPWFAERLGRRGALAVYFALMLVFIALSFGKLFYMGSSALPWFFVCLFFLGFGGANFAVYTLWLPEQYPSECRASAFAFATSFARFGGAGITFLVGAGVQRYGSLGMPVALTSLAFALGLLLIPFGAETRGQVLPA